jgi:hypothetical protein
VELCTSRPAFISINLTDIRELSVVDKKRDFFLLTDRYRIQGHGEEIAATEDSGFGCGGVPADNPSG